MDAFGTRQIDALQAQIQQIQQLMSQPRTLPAAPAPQPQKPVTTIQEVDGLEGARKFLQGLGPSSSAAVFDKAESVFYGLSVDANGIPAPIKIGRYTLEDAPEPGSDTLTKADLEAFEARIMALVAGKMKTEEE